MEIKIRYRSVDHFSASARFKTLKGASAYAQRWVGETPELGSTYAISGDGVGRITVEGCALTDLFPKLAEPQGCPHCDPEGENCLNHGGPQ